MISQKIAPRHYAVAAHRVDEHLPAKPQKVDDTFVHQVRAASREAAEQAVIELLVRGRSTDESGPMARRADQSFRVLVVEPPVPAEGKEATFLAEHNKAWKDVERHTPSRVYWVKAAPAFLAGEQESIWDLPFSVVLAGDRWEAMNQALLLAFPTAPPHPSPEADMFHVLAFPASVVFAPPLVVSDPSALLLGQSIAPLYDDFELVSADAYRELYAQKISPKRLDFILPAYFSDPIKQMHYRHAALRDEVIRMCFEMGHGGIDFDEAPPAENGVSRTWLQEMCEPPAETEPEYFINGEWGWYATRESSFKAWNIAREEVHSAYHALRPVDLLRYTCSELAEDVIQEWSHRFPWSPDFLPDTREQQNLCNGGHLLENEHDLRPWYTLHTKLWARYTQDCQEWAQGKAYGLGTTLHGTSLEAHPWLRKEFSVDVGKSMEKALPPAPTPDGYPNAEKLGALNLWTSPETWKQLHPGVESVTVHFIESQPERER